MHPVSTTTLIDAFGRRFPYLRLSVLDACNFRCSYCLPNGYRAKEGRSRYLEHDEIQRLISAFASLGMRKLRISGGEPSLRRDLPAIIGAASSVTGVESVALTTNGGTLHRHLDRWLDNGLTGLNVSVDALCAERFERITGHAGLPDLLAGLDRALRSALASVKINAVLLRDLNDDQLPAWLDYLRERDITVRFIELMQTGDNLDYFQRHHYRADVLERDLIEQGWTLLERAADAGPAREYQHPQYRGRIGVIAPYSKDFCAGCNRLRVTATGDLRLCLFGDAGIPLRPLLQDDAQQDELRAMLVRQLGLKQASHGLHLGNTGLIQNFASIGG